MYAKQKAQGRFTASLGLSLRNFLKIPFRSWDGTMRAFDLHTAQEGAQITPVHLAPGHVYVERLGTGIAWSPPAHLRHRADRAAAAPPRDARLTAGRHIRPPMIE
jgi:hypothetical protein